MAEHTFEVETYDVDLHPVPDADGATRSLRLESASGAARDVAYLNFYPPDGYAPRARLGTSRDATSLTVRLPEEEFDRFYHVLQTEEPVYCYAQYHPGEDPVVDVDEFGVTTELEMVGEGFTDHSP
ncbi:MAG: hypothetical protein ABEJ70_04880 [Halobacteriaceae archaeon]